jgi:hypothetical protein
MVGGAAGAETEWVALREGLGGAERGEWVARKEASGRVGGAEREREVTTAPFTTRSSLLFLHS